MTVDQPHHTETGRPAPPSSGRTGAMFGILLLAGAAALGWFIYKGISARVSAETTLAKEAQSSASLVVSVTHPKQTEASQEIALPGNMQAFVDAPIYARTSGYLKKWYVDIGAQVKTGQLLAEIDAPDVDHQLEQARADLETARATLKLAEVQAERWRTLLKQNAVSQDEADQKFSALETDRSAVNSLTANVKRLEDLQSFEKVTAPFDGVITSRKTDIGTLINAGAGSSAGPELFHIVAADRLRVFINVPEQYQQMAQTGMKEAITLQEFPGREFTGIIARNANTIDPASRTLLVEVDVDNPKGELLPGAYALVHLKVPKQEAAITVPVSCMLFRSEGLRVASVRDGKAHLLPIQIGRDFGDNLEVVSGVNPDETLILNPPDSLVEGAVVQVAK